MAKDDKARSVFVTGLKNAHALENQALELMNRQIERIENYPDVVARLKQHVEETNGQISRLESILDSLNESRSILKDNALAFTGNMAAMSHAVMQDEILKNTFANFAFENFEIASYKSLILVARAVGHENAVAQLEQSLQEEETMAEWIDKHIGSVTSTYLQRELADQKSGL